MINGFFFCKVIYFIRQINALNTFTGHWNFKHNRLLKRWCDFSVLESHLWTLKCCRFNCGRMGSWFVESWKEQHHFQQFYTNNSHNISLIIAVNRCVNAAVLIISESINCNSCNSMRVAHSFSVHYVDQKRMNSQFISNRLRERLEMTKSQTEEIFIRLMLFNNNSPSNVINR